MSSPKSVVESPPSQQIFKMLSGKWIAQAVSVAATLGIADRLADGPLTVGQLAAVTSTHADSLFRLLRALGASARRRNSKSSLAARGSGWAKFI